MGSSAFCRTCDNKKIIHFCRVSASAELHNEITAPGCNLVCLLFSRQQLAFAREHVVLGVLILKLKKYHHKRRVKVMSETHFP